MFYSFLCISRIARTEPTDLFYGMIRTANIKEERGGVAECSSRRFGPCSVSDYTQTEELENLNPLIKPEILKTLTFFLFVCLKLEKCSKEDGRGYAGSESDLILCLGLIYLNGS